MKKHCTILHTEDASQWCDYVEKLFTKDTRQNLAIDNINIDMLDYENPPQIEMAIRNSYLVIILASPNMKEFMIEKSNWFLPLVSKIPQGTSLAILLCYVTHEDFQDAMKSNYPVLVDMKYDTISVDTKENMNIVADYIGTIDKNEHRPKPKQRKPHHTHSCTVKEVTPNRVHGANEHVVVSCSIVLEGLYQVGFVGDSEIYDTKTLNPYTFRFRTPNKAPGSYKLQILKDGKEIHQQPFYYLSPSETAFQSVGYLQQVFKMKDTEGLEHALVDIMERSLPEDDSLTSLFEKIQHVVLEGSTKSEAEIPTLLHFAAANGLSDFCSFLLDIPWSVAAFQIENKSGQNPSELADSSGHHDLAEYIRDFMEAKAVVTTCDMYIGMNGSYDKTESSYLDMTTPQDTAEKEGPYSTAIELSAATQSLHRSSLPTPSVKPKPPLPPIPRRARSSTETTAPLTSQNETTSKPVSQQAADFMGLCKKDYNPAPAAFVSSNQKELIQIMESVKQGDFNTDDAMQLFNAWKDKNKNENTKSFKKKRESLKQMRKNYSKIWEATETTAEDVYNRTGGSLLQRLLSKKGTKKRQPPEISEPFQTRPVRTLQTLHENDRLSSSSNSSRDSNASATEVFGSDNDQSDEDQSTLVVRRISSCSSENMNKRTSRKDMFLELTKNLDEERPPLPPRTYTRRN